MPMLRGKYKKKKEKKCVKSFYEKYKCTKKRKTLRSAKKKGHQKKRFEKGSKFK